MGIRERKLSKSFGAYLEQEVKTGAAWINGEPIYRAVIDCGALPNATTKNVAHGLTFGTAIDLRGYSTESTNWIPLPYVDTSTTSLVELRITATNIVLVTAVNLSSYTETYVIVEYIK